MPDSRDVEGAKTSDISLNCNWVIWAHLPHDTDWTLDSYYTLCIITNMDEAISITENLPGDLATHCMLFIMREGISPTWEDDKNRDGGSFSYKMQNRFVGSAWKELSYRTYGETLVDSSSSAKINGITVSPKKNFCIVKLWTSDCTVTDPAQLGIGGPHFDPRTCIFKKHNSLRS